MQTYVILSTFSPRAFDQPADFKHLAERVSNRIKEECPGVTWKSSYATLGRFDVVDVVESESVEQVQKAAMIIHAMGRSNTETMTATPWKSFLDNL
jgi:uncharacterized protein with GYD domain